MTRRLGSTRAAGAAKLGLSTGAVLGLAFGAVLGPRIAVAAAVLVVVVTALESTRWVESDEGDA